MYRPPGSKTLMANNRWLTPPAKMCRLWAEEMQDRNWVDYRESELSDDYLRDRSIVNFASAELMSTATLLLKYLPLKRSGGSGGD